LTDGRCTVHLSNRTKPTKSLVEFIQVQENGKDGKGRLYHHMYLVVQIQGKGIHCIARRKRSKMERVGRASHRSNLCIITFGFYLAGFPRTYPPRERKSKIWYKQISCLFISYRAHLGFWQTKRNESYAKPLCKCTQFLRCILKFLFPKRPIMEIVCPPSYAHFSFSFLHSYSLFSGSISQISR